MPALHSVSTRNAARTGASLAALFIALLVPAADAGQPADHDLGTGAWSWFADPRAVFHAGRHRRTYTGWVGRDGSVYVASHDHDTHRLVRAKLHPGLGYDDHNNPALLLLPSGRIVAFYSGHTGAHLHYRVMRRAEDVRSFGPEHTLRRNLPGRYGFTYPNPVTLSSEPGRIYLFFRGGDRQPDLYVREQGRWSAPVTVIRENAAGLQRPYVKVATNGTDTIHLAFTEGHPARYPNSIYHVEYRAGRFYTAAGEEVGTIAQMPLEPTPALRVYDGMANPRAWIHDVAVDSAGRPVLVFATFPSTRDHRYHYARWTGQRWEDHEIVAAGPSFSHSTRALNYSPGISLDPGDPSIVYLSRRVDGEYEIERWQTSDGGTSWTARPITNRSKVHQLRPVSPRGLTQGGVVLWMRGEYEGYRAFLTSIYMLLPPEARALTARP